MVGQMQATTDLQVVQCWCGMLFAVPMPFYRHHHATRDHQIFCPVGHASVLMGPSWTEQIEDLKLQIQRRDNALDEARRKAERLHKRLKKGVCPYCKRTFSNLQQHMTCKHP